MIFITYNNNNNNIYNIETNHLEVLNKVWCQIPNEYDNDKSKYKTDYKEFVSGNKSISIIDVAISSYKKKVGHIDWDMSDELALRVIKEYVKVDSTSLSKYYLTKISSEVDNAFYCEFDLPEDIDNEVISHNKFLCITNSDLVNSWKMTCFWYKNNSDENDDDKQSMEKFFNNIYLEEIFENKIENSKDYIEKPITYIINTATDVYHREGCRVIQQINEDNKKIINQTSSYIKSMGYMPCEICTP